MQRPHQAPRVALLAALRVPGGLCAAALLCAVDVGGAPGANAEGEGEADDEGVGVQDHGCGTPGGDQPRPASETCFLCFPGGHGA